MNDILISARERPGVAFHTPSLEEMAFRQSLLADEDTMAYNRAWGGTIPFPREKWGPWYDIWVARPEGGRFYRYVTNRGLFVGEAAWHTDEESGRCLADVIILARERGRGCGGEALRLLCARARNSGIAEIWDDSALDNPALRMFLKAGFTEEYRTETAVWVKKVL